MTCRHKRLGAAARLAALTAAIVVASACASGPRAVQSGPSGAWAAARVAAADAVRGGRFSDADYILADFARRYPGSREAHEGLYWRALYRLDPDNRDVRPGDAVAAVDEYLARAGRAARQEMIVLRRVAARLDALGRDAGARREVVTVTREDDKELERVRQELKTTQEELERIKRRLANPKP
jgi:hypothetical protein